MRNLSETDEDSLDLASLQCLTRTRSGVLNVLMGVGVVVALSGLILRSRPAGALAGNPTWLSQAMLMVLFGVFVVSTVLRRVLGRRTRLRDPGRAAGGSSRATSCPPSWERLPRPWDWLTAGWSRPTRGGHPVLGRGPAPGNTRLPPGRAGRL